MSYQELRGALLFTLALLLFACLDTTTKILADEFAVPLVVAARYTVQCLLMIAILAPSHGKALLQTHRTGLVLFRAFCLAAASLSVGLALQRMPVAETTAIIFIAPVLVVLLAGPLLGESISAVAWVAAGAGFCGVMLVVRPSSGLEAVGVAFALVTVIANVGYQLLSRVLVTSESTVALLFYTGLVGSIGFCLTVPWFLEGRPPSGLELLLFLSTGVYGGLGHYLFTAAYRYALASTLAPMTYMQLLWAGLLGGLVFGHVPDAITLAGMLLIGASGVAVAIGSKSGLGGKSNSHIDARTP